MAALRRGSKKHTFYGPTFGTEKLSFCCAKIVVSCVRNTHEVNAGVRTLRQYRVFPGNIESDLGGKLTFRVRVLQWSSR